ncbi:SpaH/EbpB family LPXTG-anchored major pilin [Enterococcus asini]|uniref:SpaH/EbpB family LPXTG-anchored major pilin n=1 Tax=Enterococcus asini TaxID=57732 RepID=A0AAW8TZ90_9ENTE|nr:SpaH/EbpB family LPXTG-anchored major pilin [Enterococcus asini]MDT2809065.1 SpaH/EbpB family LPXTG-anchored major pilin [Enterococcus asini]
MKKKSNWRTILATLIMVLPFVLGFGASNGIQASAAEGDATITIHKKKMLSLPGDIQNTGDLMDEQFGDYEPLPGVTFTIYDVTEEFYEAYTGEATQQDALDAVKDLDPTTLTKVDSGVTDKDGELPFLNIPKKSGDQDAVYLIVETPKDGVTVASNMVVAFPVYQMNEDGTYTEKELSDIHLYPKNVVTTDGALQVTKKGTAEGELLNGAEFVISRVVDGETQYISDAKDGLYTWTPNKDEAQKFITGNDYTIGEDGITSTTGEKGILNVSGLEVGDYTLIETKAPDNAGLIASETEKPFTVTESTTTDAPVEVPVNNDTMKVEKTTPNLDGKDVEIGAPIDYQISTNIPLGIADKNEDGSNYYTVFTLTDTHSEFLTFVNDSKKYSLKMEDTVIDPANYTITEGENSFVVKINAEYIPSLTPGAQLVFDYQMYLNENATPDQGFDNIADVDTDHTEDTSDKVTVITGGEKFIKKDQDTDKTLAGAVFVVKNEDGKYLVIDKNTKAISWVESITDDAKFTTGADGLIDLQGLEYGDYTLVEIQAPDGYVTPETPNNETDFTVAEGSYTDAVEISIPNKHKGSLPSTGGKGIVAFVAVGVVAIAGAGLYFMKGRKHIEG